MYIYYVKKLWKIFVWKRLRYFGLVEMDWSFMEDLVKIVGIISKMFIFI